MALGLGSTSQLGIGLAMHLDDQFSKGAQNVTKQLEAMQMSAQGFQNSLHYLDRFGAGLAAIGDQAIRAGVAGLTEFAKFEKTMTSVAVIGGIEKTDAKFKMLSDSAVNLSSKYGQLPADIAEAQLELAKAGKSADEILKLTDAVLTLGAATDTAVAGKNGAAEMLVNIMQAFNAGSSEAAYYADVLTSAANRSTIDVTDFYESMKYSSDMATSLGIPVKKAAQAIATLGNAGIKGSSAGVAYANMLRYITTGVTALGATKKQKKALEAMGLTGADFLDAKGNLIDLGGILDILRKKTAGWSQPDTIAAFTAMFGVRGNRGLIPLIRGMETDPVTGKRVSTYESMGRDMDKDIAGGIAEATAIKRLDNLTGSWSKLTATWSQFKIAVGGSLAPVVRPFIDILRKFMEWVTAASNSQFGQWLIRATILFTAAMSPIGRLISAGAQFAAFMTQSTGVFKSGMETGLMLAKQIQAVLLSTAKEFQASMLMSQAGVAGTTVIPGRNGGPATRRYRDAGGKFLAGKVNWLSRLAGSIAGKKGIAWASRVTTGPFGFVVKILTKFGFVLGKVGSMFGFLAKVGGWLLKGFFSWWFIIGDLIVTLTTGKSIFEWLWEALKGLAGWIESMFGTSKGEEVKKPASIGTKEERDEVIRQSITPMGSEDLRKLYRSTINGAPSSVAVHVTVNPTTGDKRTEHYINTETSRQLAGEGIKVHV